LPTTMREEDKGDQRGEVRRCVFKVKAGGREARSAIGARSLVHRWEGRESEVALEVGARR
jgi:hypothetical protein